MLPGFPKIRAKRVEGNGATIQFVARQVSPLIGEIKRHAQFEGEGNIIERHDDTVSDSGMGKISAVMTVPNMPLDEFTERRHLAYLVDAGRQMAEGATRHLLGELDRQLTDVGQVIDAGGKPFSEELILETLDKLHHEFTDDGDWIPPTIVIGRPTLPGNPSDSFNRRLAELLNRKRDDFRRREADRVLAG